MYALAPENVFILLFVFALVIFVYAGIMRTELSCFISSVTWFGTAWTVLSVADPESGLTLGFSYIGMLLGIIMLLVGIGQTFERMKRNAEEKQRRMAEEIVL